MKKVLIFGSFDLIHPGHIFIISEARRLGRVHVCLARDETIQSIKGRTPYNSLVQRAANLKKYRVITHKGDAEDRLQVLKSVNPDYVLLGHDQKIFVPELKEYIRKNKGSAQLWHLPPFYPHLFSSRKIRPALENPSAGFLFIDKPTGEPSFRTIEDLRKIIGIRQIGFAGTLDPLASGLLVCGIAEATKLLDWWHLFPKTYEVTAQLGVISDTYDREGKIETRSDAVLKEQEIISVTKSFIGMQRQTPPIFSAKKIGGKKLYEFARKGISVQPKPAEVTIHSIELIKYSYPNVSLRVTCSSGTYIRSLVNDFGEKLQTGAIVTKLSRTAIGPYTLSQAMSLADESKETIFQRRIDVEKIISKLIEFLFS